MKKIKYNNILMHGFMLVTILATARSAETEITMEAAFQGHCGHTSPCEQLCYEIHDGMYECDCIEGYELNKNGYSCQVINSTSNGDGHSKSDEDVLYQKGASFSAKLANGNERDNQLSPGYSSSTSLTSALSGPDEDNLEDVDSYFGDNLYAASPQQQKVNSNDYYISSETIQLSNGQDSEPHSGSRNVPEFKAQKMPSVNSNGQRAQRLIVTTDKNLKLALNSNGNTYSQPNTARGTTASTLTPDVLNTEAILNSNLEYDYYSKQDMSIYDDVNNNQLNLRPVSRNTYQNQKTHNSGSKQTSISHDYQNRPNEAAGTASVQATSTDGEDAIKILQNINISTTTGATENMSDACNLDCGLEGLCDNSEGSSKCLCPFGKAGNHCNEDSKVNMPKFSRRSWLAFPALRGAYKHVQVRVEFRPESFDGIILLSGERDDLTGDFMALLLNKGFVEFWFDCGSGVGSVRSRETVLLNEWNSVIIYRHRWDAWLVLNHGTKVQGRSNGLFSRITFREPVFLGGTGNITGLAKRLPVFNGFVGCIRRFVANEHEYKFVEHPLGDVTKGFGIQDCSTDKCFKYPCQHGGKCLPTEQGAVCLCPIGFVGDLCEIRMDLEVPAFNGSSYLRYAPLGDTALIWLELKVILKPEQLDGLILYSGPEKRGDFIALSLNEGFVEFTFDLGSGPAVVKSDYPLTMGQWHTIRVSRTARLAVLKIDKAAEVMTISSNGFWHLSLPQNLFLGGVNHMDKLPADLKFKPFFVGCIQRIDINGHALAIISEALGGSNIGNCPHACIARPCGPLAECVPQMESYECRCSAFNAQCNKAAEVPLEELQLNKAKNKSKSIEARQFGEHEIKMKKPALHKQKKVHGKEHGRYLHKIAPPTSPPTTDTATTTTTSTSTSISTTTAKTPHADDIEDDIIFRDVHGMHRKYGHNEQAQRSNEKAQRNRNTNKRKYISKPQQGKGYNYGSKPDPYQKHTTIERKLSKLPTHYESFQTNPESDILTYDDSIDVKTSKQQDDFPNHNNYDVVANDNADNRDEIDIASEPFVLDENIFDDYDGTEDYQRKQLAQDMQRIMSNKPSDTNKRPKLVLNEYEYSEEESNNDYEDEQTNENVDDVVSADNTDNTDDDLLEPVHKPQVSDERQTLTTTPQTHTDWSLLKKLDLAADHQSQIGVRKSFGACFAGKDSYFHYNDAETMSQIISYNIDLNLRIKTHSDSGVILWTGRQGTTEEDADYLSLGIENGYLHFRYDLGSGEVDIRFNMTKVSDGLWHRVRAIRDSQEGYLEVDGRKSISQRSPGKLRQLNTDTGLYVGGMPDVSYFTRRKYNSGIVGCISEIILAGELKLNFDPNTLGTAHNVETGIL